MPISTITGKPQPSFDDKMKFARGLKQLATEYNPITKLKELDQTLGGIRRGEIAYNDPRALQAAFTLASAGTMAPGGGGGVANIGFKDALEGLATDFRDMYKDPNFGDIARRQLSNLHKKHGLAGWENYSTKTVTKEIGEANAKKAFRDTYRQHIKEIKNVPPEVYESLDDIALKASANSPLGTYHPTENYIDLNPGFNQGENSFTHEITHYLQHKWAQPGNLYRWNKLTPKEQKRFLTARSILDVSEALKKQQTGWSYSGSQHYWSNPIERQGRAMQKWMTKFVKREGRRPTADEFYGQWDAQQHLLLKNLKKQAPNTWKKIVIKGLKDMKGKLGIDYQEVFNKAR